jgi:hypothetical protein
VALVRTGVSEDRIASIIRVKGIGELGETLAVTSLLIRATRHHITQDDILYSQRRESLKSYIALTGWAL